MIPVPTLVRAALRRVHCRHCGVRIEHVPWARTRSRLTHAFEAEVLRRARDCSASGVCRQLGLHWTSVMRLIEHWIRDSAARRFKKPRRVIGVDEVSYGRGKRTIVWITPGHAWSGSAEPGARHPGCLLHQARPRRSRRIRVVTMDMWQGYIGPVQAYAPLAEIAFDRFHIERYLTQAVEEVRRQAFFRRGARLPRRGPRQEVAAPDQVPASPPAQASRAGPTRPSRACATSLSMAQTPELVATHLAHRIL
jgi:transposase